MTSPNTQIYKKIYAKLNDLNLFPAGKPFVDDVVLTSPGFMDLHIESLPGCRDESRRSKKLVSFSHFYKPNYDGICNPKIEIEIGINHKSKEVYPLTFRNDSIPLRSDTQAYGKVDSKLEEDIGYFLINWLNILQQQGFFKSLNTQAVTNSCPF